MTAASFSADHHHSGFSRRQNTNTNAGGNPRFKQGFIYTADTVDDTDTIAVDIFQEFGMTRFMGIEGLEHTTSNSVIVTAAPTTIVQGTTVTITVGGSNDNNIRGFVIYGI